MLGAIVNAKIAKLTPAQWTARQHALDRLLDDPLREPPFEVELRRALFYAADEAGVVVVDLLLQLAAGENHLLGIDDDDVVATVHMGRVGGLVLAAQSHGDNGRETADNQTGAVDHHPFLDDVGGLGRIRAHRIFPVWRFEVGVYPTGQPGSTAATIIFRIISSFYV